MIFSAARYTIGLAWDAAEALLYSLNTNRADVLWASARTDTADRLVEKEAQEEVAEPRFEDQPVCVCGSTSCAATVETSCHPIDPSHSCWCLRCNPGAWWLVTCAECGSKRCPKAVWHEHLCERDDSPRSPAGGEAPTLPADAPRCTSPDPSAGQPTSSVPTEEGPEPPSLSVNTEVEAPGTPTLTKNELRNLAEAARNAGNNYKTGGFAWRHWRELSEKTFRIAHAVDTTDLTDHLRDDDLKRAVYAVREFADNVYAGDYNVYEHARWHRLADRLQTASGAMK